MLNIPPMWMYMWTVAENFKRHMKYNKLNSATTDFTGICELASIALFAHSDYGICMKVFWSKSVISEQCKYYSSPTDCGEIIVSALNNRGRHVGKLTWRRKKNDIQNNKLVKGRLRCQRCVLIIKKSCSWPWLSTGMDFSDDVFVSAAEVEDNNEVIENLSNLACDKSSGGDLMDPKVCCYARGLGNSVGWAQRTDSRIMFSW